MATNTTSQPSDAAQQPDPPDPQPQPDEKITTGVIPFNGTVKYLTAAGVVVAWAAGSAYFLRRYRADPETVIKLVKEAIVPSTKAAAALVKAILSGSFTIHVEIRTLDALDEIWKSYNEGDMKKKLEKVIVTDDLRSLAPDDAKNVDISLEISEDDYGKTRDYLLQCALQNYCKGYKSSPATSEETSALTKQVKNVGLYVTDEYKAKSISFKPGMIEWKVLKKLLTKATILPVIREKRITLEISDPIEAIAQALVETSADLNVKDAQGETLLIYSAKTGEEKAVQLLVNAGADVNVTDKEGKTILMYAAQAGNEGVLELLVNAGVDVNLPKPWKVEVLVNKLTSMKASLARDKICMTSGKYREGIECFENSLGMIQEKDYHEDIAICYFRLGDCYRMLNKYSEAVINYEQGLSIIVNLKMPTRLEGDICHGLGISLNQLNRHRDAKEYLGQALIIAKQIEEGNLEWRCNIDLSLLFHKQRIYRMAVEYAVHALEIAHKRNNAEEIMKTYDVLSCALAPLGRIREAIDYGELYLNHTKQVGNREAEAKALENLSLFYTQIHDSDKAISYAEKSIEIAKETGDLNTEGSAYHVMGNALCEKGKVKEAMEYHMKQLEIAAQTGDKLAEAKANCQLGLVSMKLSKHYDAIRYSRTCIKLNSELGCENANNAPYNTLGLIYARVGKYHEAAECYQQCLVITKRTGKISGEISAYQNLSNVYSELNNNLAGEYKWKSIILSIRTGDKRGELRYFLDLGKCFSSNEQFSESITNHKKALHLALEIKDSDVIGDSYLYLGNTYSQSGMMDEAMDAYEMALDRFTDLSNKQQEALCRLQIGEFYNKLAKNQKKCNDNVKYAKNITMSEEYLRGSIQCFDDLREKHKLKMSILDTYAFAYKQLALLLIETNRTGEALLVCERGLAFALGNNLVSKYGMQHAFVENRKPLNESDLTDLLPNKSCILFYSIMPSSAKLCMWVLSQQRLLIHTQHEMEENSIRKKNVTEYIYELADSAYQSMNVAQMVANYEDRSRRKQKLCYSEGDVYPLQLSYSFARMKLEQDITDKKYLKSSISRSPLESTSTDSDQQYHTKEPLKELFKQLISPVQEHLTEDEIVVIPDGPLNLVPFAALQDPQTGCFLCETKRIRLAPSLTTLKILKECYHSKIGVLVIGNPRVGEVMFRGEKKKITRLPAAEREARMVSGILTDILKVSTLIGEATTKDAVKEKLQDAAVIHIAAHGDDTTGEIALAPGISAKSKVIPDEEDYILTMQEVQNIGVRAKLVVLSYSHSSREEIRAEGVVGMARAFLAAGARAVVASLWANDDGATLDFMRHFYIQLKLGKSTSVSLNKSMKKMIEGQRYNQPKYWAPFFLIGDDVTIY